jgi:hypothetical protein
MILAVRRADADDTIRLAQRNAERRGQVAELKAFYGVAQQALETLLTLTMEPDTSPASCLATG